MFMTRRKGVVAPGMLDGTSFQGSNRASGSIRGLGSPLDFPSTLIFSHVHISRQLIYGFIGLDGSAQTVNTSGQDCPEGNDYEHSLHVWVGVAHK